MSENVRKCPAEKKTRLRAYGGVCLESPPMPPGTRIGISGWVYPPWRGVFYPKGLAQKRELEYAARTFNSIEINGSFYSLQRPQSYQAWHDATPDDFVFAVKGGRFITHMKKLKEVEIPLANFLASGILKLKQKLGPILWQFPPGFAFNEQRFDDFFALLPRSTVAAARIARKHDARMAGRAWTRADADRPLRHAIEIRHESFRDPRFLALLRKHRIALVVADTAGKWPLIDEITTDFMYARLHGDEELYVSGYTPAALDAWADRVRKWKRKGCDVYVYFDNDAKVRAPFDALQLAARLEGRDPQPPPLELLEAAGEEARAHWPALRPARGARRASGDRRP